MTLFKPWQVLYFVLQFLYSIFEIGYYVYINQLHYFYFVSRDCQLIIKYFKFICHTRLHILNWFMFSDQHIDQLTVLNYHHHQIEDKVELG